MNGTEFCGACGARVPQGGTCESGVSRCVEEGKSDCDGYCSSLDNDSNCGACGHACSDTANCEEHPTASNTPAACVFQSGAYAGGTAGGGLVRYTEDMTCNAVCQQVGGTCWDGGGDRQYAYYGCGGSHAEGTVACNEAVSLTADVDGVSSPCSLLWMYCTCAQP